MEENTRFDIKKVNGIGEYVKEEATLGESDNKESVAIYKVKLESRKDELDSNDFVDEGERAFLVVRKNTLEVRTDRKLLNLLREKYETVMESRYFGRGGAEIVNSGQLTDDELYDLVRLSYNLSKEEA